MEAPPNQCESAQLAQQYETSLLSDQAVREVPMTEDAPDHAADGAAAAMREVDTDAAG